jgi:hypothetical protein
LMVTDALGKLRGHTKQIKGPPPRFVPPKRRNFKAFAPRENKNWDEKTAAAGAKAARSTAVQNLFACAHLICPIPHTFSDSAPKSIGLVWFPRVEATSSGSALRAVAGAARDGLALLVNLLPLSVQLFKKPDDLTRAVRQDDNAFALALGLLSASVLFKGVHIASRELGIWNSQRQAMITVPFRGAEFKFARACQRFCRVRFVD